MRIAYFNANLLRGQDGVTRVMYQMFDAARERHHEAMAFTSTLPEDHDRIIPMYKVRSVSLPLHKSYRIALPGYQLFAKILTEFSPDLIHINSPCTLGFGAMKYAHQFNVPIVATYHTHFPSYPRYYRLHGLEELTWKISRYLYNRVNRTFVPTQPILEELKEHQIERLECLPNGVDLQLFNPARRSQAWRANISAQDKPILLFVSRLVWEKDLSVLAQAYQRLSRTRSDFEMVIVGDGHAREDLQQLMPGAHFLGYQTGQVLAESYASADIFVFPSTTETFGLVTLEAMASGLAPVAAKIGGAVGIIRDGKSGLFSAPLDADSLADRVELLLDNPDARRQIAWNARERASEFSWGKVLDQLFESYQSVIREHRGRHARAA